MNTYIASTLIALTFGIARAEQGDGNSSMEGVLRIVTHPCVGSSVTIVPAFQQVSSTSHLLPFLERELNITIGEAMEASVAMQSWSALLDYNTRVRLQAYVRILQIPNTQHNNLSEIENSGLRVYLQLANYAHFLMKQETAGYTTIIGGTGSLLKPDLRIQIRRVMCKLLELLQLNDQKLRVFATQYIAGHLFPLDVMNMSRGIKRAACRAAVELMFDTIRQIIVSKETGSVQMPVNI